MGCCFFFWQNCKTESTRVPLPHYLHLLRLRLPPVVPPVSAVVVLVAEEEAYPSVGRMGEEEEVVVAVDAHRMW